MTSRLARWSAVVVFGAAASCAAPQRSEPAPPPPEFPVIIGRAPVTIDGSFSDWPPQVPVARVASPDGAHACAFRVFVDATRVYAAFDVTDSTPVVNTNGPGRNWQGDAVELFIGTHAKSRDKLDKGDAQVVISFNPQKPLAWNFFTHVPMKDSVVVAKEAPGGWHVEASFTFEDLGIDPPVAGGPVWIDFALDNSEYAGRAAQYPWHGTLELYKRPSMWMKSMFVPLP